MLPRTALESSVRRALARSRGVVLAGPRQSGKSTLAQRFVPRDSFHYFDLEYPPHAQRLSEPAQVLERLQGLVVIDEVQRRPDLFPLLRVLMDRSDAPGQYLLLGSASPNLARQAGESLLGRVEVVEVAGFDVQEVHPAGGPWDDAAVDRLWLRGGFPRSWLADTDEDSYAWRHGAIAQHVQADLPQFGLGVPAPAMLRFWTMLAHCHGQVWSAADPARSMAVSEPTIRRYLDILTQTMMVRQLQPWHENLGKRQVKSPKIYFRDTGLLHALMDVRTLPQLLTHPRAGASWEGFALEQVLRLAKPDQAWFWATHQGAELDLLMLRGSRRIGVEFKRADAPRVTPSMRIAIDDLKLDSLYVVYPGAQRFQMAGGVEAVPLWALLPVADDRPVARPR
ncbi:ATP-binding protein [Ramlibacter monticola]|uniref:ATP-binding protein n=1 Tax=Ramlibacter monticola TaxID=1926872 RepID=A0A936YZ57_9BURK|nr:ATP-binding protein [Ramlibacter monticola]MBL0392123.1 ATP-binding protein [Ramlibacter monticola]